MRIGVWIPLKYLHSVRIYFEQVKKRLEQKGVVFVPYSSGDEIPLDVDLYWDATCTGGKNPQKKLLNVKKPLVATVHGAANLALPHHYTYRGTWNQLKGHFINAKRKFFWGKFRQKVSGIITVSQFAKEEITRELNLDPSIITPIYHGYDSSIFYPIADAKRDFLFHVSVYQPVKNVETLLKAYAAIPEKERIPLVMVVPGFPDKISMPGLTLITESQSQEKIASYMQHARAFVLCSVRESFGLPIIEAMACGTPVITSKGSACEEITSDYGLLCKPDVVSEWTDAMKLLSKNDDIFVKLQQKSLERAQYFSWDKSADAHFEFFKRTINKTV